MAGKSEGLGFAVPVALFYGALFVVYGMHVPFMPVWLDWRGLSAGEISAVMAAPYFLRVLVTPAIAIAADETGAYRRYLIVISWLALAFVLALAAARPLWMIPVFAVLLMIANATLMPLIDTLAVLGMRLRGLDYGRMRLWGSLTFVAASFLGGIAMTSFGSGAGVWLIAIGSAMTALASFLLPEVSGTSSRRLTPASLWKAATAPRELLVRREFVLFLVAAGLVQAGHATFLTFGTLLWQKQGYSPAWSGALWAIGVFAEVLLFSVSGRVAERIGAARLLVISAATSVMRWIAMAFAPPLALLVPLQILHGATYGAAQIGAMHFIRHAIPHERGASAQALYAIVAQGIAMGFATLIAGFIYAAAGALSYLAMAVIALAALLGALRLAAVWDGGVLPPRGLVSAPERGEGREDTPPFDL